MFFSSRSSLLSSGLVTAFRLNSTTTTPTNNIGKLILVRHGQSIWNVNDPTLNLTSRFTGWTDIPLTLRGEQQARAAGSALKSLPDLTITTAYVSLLKRASETLKIITNEMNLRLESSIKSSVYKIPVTSTWRLNERHYGSLCGKSKLEAESEFSIEELSKWRNGWDTAPPKMDAVTLGRWRKAEHCRVDTHYVGVGEEEGERVTVNENDGFEKQLHSFSEPGAFMRKKDQHKINTTNWKSTMKAEMPASESLKDTVERVLPLWETGLKPGLLSGETILIVAHANTIRSLLYHFDPHVDKDTLKGVKIPSAHPLICSFENIKGDLVNVGEACEKTKLRAEWVDSEEIEKVSFCTLVGQSALEHEIA